MKLKLSISFFLTLIGSYLLAQSSSWKFDYSSELEVNALWYLSDADHPEHTQDFLSKHSFQSRYKYHLKANASLITIYNQQNSERSRIFLNEAFVSFNKGGFNGKIGKQIFDWGNSTSLSALDLANAYDYFDFLDTDEQELGLWGFDLKYQQGIHTLQIGIIPQNNKSRIYIRDHNWTRLPSSISLTQNEPPSIPVVYNSKKTLNSTSSTSFGLNYSLELLGFDWGLNYYNGLNDIPLKSLEFNVDPFSNNLNYNINLHYHRMQIATIKSAKLLGNWSIVGEFAWIQNKIIGENDQLTDDTYLMINASADRIFTFDDPEKLLRLLVQYRHTLFDELTYGPTDLDHVLDHSFFIDSSYDINYKFSFKSRLVISLPLDGLMISKQMNYRFNDNISTSIGLDLFMGTVSDFFGHFSNMDRLTIRLKATL